MQLEHGADYCTSWYAMKEALRRRFAPPLEPEKTILSCSGSSYMGASELSCADSIKKAIFATKPLVSSKAIQQEDSQLFQQVDVPVVQAPVIHESDDYSIASGLDSSASPCDTKSEIKIDDTNDVALSGLSMMAREVHSDGTIIDVRGQRSNIFQSECKIQGKVCKLIIDGGSFANVVSSDLVHALSLSTRRLPTPRYMQWMNQSGTLKITHKARVKFSIGTYVDTVDCDVAPASACHLLLGRPWQFDLDATHGGRSNNYSFVHKGVPHVLKPMPASAIKAEVFAIVKVKQKATAISPKPRTALFQEGENDVALSSEIIVRESSSKDLNPIVESDSIFEDVSNDVSNKALLVAQSHDPPMQIASAAGALKVHERENSSLDMSGKYLFNNETLVDHNSVVILTDKSQDVFDITSKPRTALFQGREDDEPMAPQNKFMENSSPISNMVIGLKFGAINFDEKYSKNMDKFTTIGLSSNIMFGGATFMKVENIKLRNYIYIGSIQVDTT
jgi:hypothetical protein